jgi:hypothetical protein
MFVLQSPVLGLSLQLSIKTCQYFAPRWSLTSCSDLRSVEPGERIAKRKNGERIWASTCQHHTQQATARALARMRHRTRTQRSEQLRYSRVSLLDGCRCLVALAPAQDGRLVIWQIGVVPHLCDHAAHLGSAMISSLSADYGAAHTSAPHPLVALVSYVSLRPSSHPWRRRHFCAPVSAVSCARLHVQQCRPRMRRRRQCPG